MAKIKYKVGDRVYVKSHNCYGRIAAEVNETKKGRTERYYRTSKLVKQKIVHLKKPEYCVVFINNSRDLGGWIPYTELEPWEGEVIESDTLEQQQVSKASIPEVNNLDSEEVTWETRYNPNDPYYDTSGFITGMIARSRFNPTQIGIIKLKECSVLGNITAIKWHGGEDNYNDAVYPCQIEVFPK